MKYAEKSGNVYAINSAVVRRASEAADLATGILADLGVEGEVCHPTDSSMTINVRGRSATVHVPYVRDRDGEGFLVERPVETKEETEAQVWAAVDSLVFARER